MRMRITYSLCLIACVLIGAGCFAVRGVQTKYGVTVNAVQPAALAKVRTYVWTVGYPALDKDTDRLIIAAVDHELVTRGLTKLPSGESDVVVSYGVVDRTDVDLKFKRREDGRLREQRVGTLVVEVRGARNRQSLFKVRIDTPMESTRAVLEAPINAAVMAMFEEYPARSKR